MTKNNLGDNEICDKIKKKLKRTKINSNTINKIYNKVSGIINKYSDKNDDDKKEFAISILEQLIRESNNSQDDKELLNNIIKSI